MHILYNVLKGFVVIKHVLVKIVKFGGENKAI